MSTVIGSEAGVTGVEPVEVNKVGTLSLRGTPKPSAGKFGERDGRGRGSCGKRYLETSLVD